jgi:hypothetical protein
MKEYLSKLAISVFAVFIPIKSVILAVGFIVLMDFVTGIMAAQKRGEEIKSAKMRHTVVKLLGYQLAILSGFIIEKYLISDFIPIVKVISGVIGITELKSLLENVECITGVSFWDKFKELFNKKIENK